MTHARLAHGVRMRPRARAPLPCLLVASAAACATPGARPDDMSAAEHRAQGAEHANATKEHEGRYDPEASATGYSIATSGTSDVAGTGNIAQPLVYNPTETHLREATKHREHADDHRAAAAELERFEGQECGRFPKETRAACPLLGAVIAVYAFDERPKPPPTRPKGVPVRLAWRRGVRIRFAAGTNLDAVVAHMRCHIAFARTRGRQGMGHCPLYLHSMALEVRRGRQPGTVELTTDDGAELEELRQRTRAHIGP